MEAAAGGDVGLEPEDRIDAQFLGRLIELQRPVQIAVIGQRQGGHPQGLRPFEQSADRAGPVQQAVVAMAMQMGEGKRAHGVPPCGEQMTDNEFYRRRDVTDRPPIVSAEASSILGLGKNEGDPAPP